MLITSYTGKEVVSGRETSVSLLFIPSHQFAGKVEPLFARARNDVSIREQGRAQYIPALNGMRPELVGQWIVSTHHVPENMLFAVRAKINQRGIVADGAVLLQTREGAPLVRINVALSRAPKAALEVAYIEGRFDVLTAQQAAAEGAQLMGQQTLIQAFIPSRRDGVMSFQTLAQQTVTRKETQITTTKNSQGEIVQVAKIKRNRQLDL